MPKRENRPAVCRFLVALTASDLLLQFLLVVVGLVVLWDPSALTSQLDLFTTPSLRDLAYSLVISMVALAGSNAWIIEIP